MSVLAERTLPRTPDDKRRVEVPDTEVTGFGNSFRRWSVSVERNGNERGPGRENPETELKDGRTGPVGTVRCPDIEVGGW